jgi:hypothetical protein
MSSLGNLLMQLGQTLPATLRKRKQDEEAAAIQAEHDALAKRVTLAQLGEIDRKTAADTAAAGDETASRKILADYGQKRALADSTQTLGQIDLNGMGGDTPAPEPTKLIPSQQADVARQANARYPSLGGLAGASVLNKGALGLAGVQRAGYSVGPGREPPEASPIAGSPAEGALARGQAELDQGAAAAGKTRTGLLSDVGGLALAHSPTMEKAFATTEKQDTADAMAAEKEQGRIAAENKQAQDQAFEMGKTRYVQGQENYRSGLSAKNKQAQSGVFPNTPEGEQDLNDYIDRVASGDASPDMKDLSSRGVQGAHAKMQAQRLFKEKYSNINLQQEITANAYWNNPKNQQQRQVMDVVSEQLPKLVEASNELKRLNVPFIDRKTMEARRATGDVTAAKYLAALAVTVEDVAKGVAGGNALTDDQLKLANQIIYKGGTPEQVAILAQEIQNGIDSRKMTMYKRGGLQAKKYAEQDPWLSDNIREKIISGTYNEKKEGVSGAGGTAKTSSGNRFSWQ